MTNEQVQEELRKFDGLENIELIPGGGQSYAFSAYDTILDRKIFLKVYYYSEQDKDSLLLEPRKLTNLYYKSENSRTHIVGLFSAEKIKIADDDYIVLRMEFCEGSNLYDEINEFGLPLQKAIKIGKEVCEGIHYLHSSNIVHRDIKPANIMVCGYKAKIIDLGSAMEIGNDEWRPVTSKKTIYYNPPEVYGSNKKYGKRSDIFQIGAVLYEMFYGRFDLNRIDQKFFERSRKKLCLEGNDDLERCQIEDETINELLNNNIFYENVTEDKKYIPKSLKKLIMQLTSSNFEKRLSSCAELRNELSRLVVPDWQMISVNEYTVTNWKGKDYRVIEDTSKNKLYCEMSVSGANKYRKVSSVYSLEEAIKKING